MNFLGFIVVLKMVLWRAVLKRLGIIRSGMGKFLVFN